ncbi:AAA family ATPase [Pseudomonas sp. Pseusp122]|uniref:trifunctional serine/threonine-protein kinase/ATP-binding protein/sensor histidine kinase n=1 Tax=unclassified Pseudomonas TaxID=196821 RepID=UPI0039A7667D
MSQLPSIQSPAPLTDRREVADFNQHWLQQLDWALLLVDGEIARYRVRSPQATREWLVVRPAARATENVFRRIQHEYAMRECLDPAWAVVPAALLSSADGPLLILDESGGRSLHENATETLSISVFLRQAIGATQALRHAHASGLLHHDIKPCNFIEGEDGAIRLTAFALSSHPDIPGPRGVDSISGSLAYMSPEQAGRVNNEIDERSDLYALGVTFYEMLTHRLPFEGDDPVEWLHQHLARQPSPPEQHRDDIPGPLSAVILKLLAKNPAERYACAQDLEDDLRLCLVQWNEFQHIRAFEPGKDGRAGTRLFPSGLIAREQQLAELHRCIARVGSTGTGEIVLIRGQTGTGKSALVRRLHRDLGGSQVMFATGKFDQSRTTTPYAALSLILRALLLRVLGESPRTLDMWRQRLLRGLAGNGRLLLPLIPELELMTGPLPGIPQISKADAANRFNDALREYILAFARPQAPLVIFFDDLQWLDNDTLGFFSYMAARQPRHILFIGAYRELSSEHSDAFRQLLSDLRDRPDPVVELSLTCLEPSATGKMLGGLLGWHDPSLTPLSDIVHLKSGGNPFFINQLVRTLLEEGLISTAGTSVGWQWDLDAIRRFPVAPNVVELMVARISRLPEETRSLLGLMALLGSRADYADIASVSEQRIGSVRKQLVAAMEAGLLIEDKAGLLFSHDRVREAAYLLIPAEQRAREHTRIARLLIRGISQQEPQAVLFRIALHIRQAAHDTLSESDTSEFISILLKAAHRARDAAALPFALQYLRLARSLGSESRWLSHYTQSHAVELLYIQCLIRRSEYDEADACISQLLERARSLAEISALYGLKVESLSLSGQYVAAVEAALLGLRMFDIQLSGEPGAFDARQAFARIEQRMGGRSIASLLELPALEDPRIEAIMGLLAGMVMAASFTDDDMLFQVLCTMVEITLDHGRCPASALGVAWFGVSLAQRLGLYDQGVRYAELAGRMVNRLGYRLFEGAVLMALGQVSVWIRPLAFSLECAEKALMFCQAEGKTALSCYVTHQRASGMLVMGTPLMQVQQCLEDGQALAEVLDAGDCRNILKNQALFAQALADGRGVLASDSAQRLGEQILAGEMVPAQFWWWFFQGVAAFYEVRHDDSRQALEQAAKLAWSTPSHIHLMELHMYSALNLTALNDTGDTEATLARLQPHLTQLRLWADLNPMSFLDKLLIVEAEAARIQGQPLIAMRLFESAIGQATTGGFVHIKALAHELAGRCHQQSGLPTTACSHRRTAREDYQRWGAMGKVRSLEAEHLYLRDQPTTSRSSIDLREGQQYLDLVSVIKASQALSREIVLDRLIELLVANTLVHAGASRGLLILIDKGVPIIVATGQARESGVIVELANSSLDSARLPLSIIYTVIRTRTSVALDQVIEDERFGGDKFFSAAAGGAVLCLPLLKQGEVTGVLYLENSLACGIFTQSRIAVIELLAAQAAISLETSRLYAQVLEENQRRRESETELRNIQALLAIGQKIIHSGAFRWDTTTDQMLWSDELFAIWGIEKSDNPPSSPALMERVHPDDRARLKTRLERIRRTRQAYRHGFRAVMPDQSIKYLETLGEPAEGAVFVGVTSDVTDRKVTETALSNARRELAQVSHSTIMGELAASIAHEINQPLASIVSNASASVRWLRREVPEVQEALEGLNDIAKDGKRAADIVHALQALAKQKVSSRSPLLIDEVIGRVLLLTAGEIEQKLVSVHTRLESSPMQVHADGVQMQQVIYNLVMNAVDAMLSVNPPHRVLTLTSSVQAGRQVVVTVEDTGPGISPAHADEIFNAFFTTKTTGMGMGLAICKSIMSAQEGTLHMLQGRAGQTIFVFTLPAIGHIA